MKNKFKILSVVLTAILLVCSVLFIVACDDDNKNDESPKHTLEGIWNTYSFDVEQFISYKEADKVKTDWLDTKTFFRITTDNKLYVEDILGNVWPAYALTFDENQEGSHIKISAKGHPQYVKLALRWYKNEDKIVCTYSNNAVIALIVLYKSK